MHLLAKGYFAVTTGALSASDVQKYIEQQEEHHKLDNFKISEF
jgi:REP element-mobilizing transposase RayT